MTRKTAAMIHPDPAMMIPRFRVARDLILDFLHRDGRIADRWIGFQPREFELLWRLAERPGEQVTRKQLLADVWRIDFEPSTNSLAVHVARVRGKLDMMGVTGLLLTHPDDGYLLDAPPYNNHA